MKTYYLTAYDPSGEKLLDETFEAESEEKAKEVGASRLEEEGYSEHTHRCVSPDAKLVLFHR
ncbi:MAG TPA: YhzD family protein [Candidatus Avamphibacillus sp.]|nr:YhzD family protein [Candidatus Avamphibacillus sp.]